MRGLGQAARDAARVLARADTGTKNRALAAMAAAIRAGEEQLLFRDMQSDMVQQIMRRIATAQTPKS